MKFSAKLLFQYRVNLGSTCGTMRTCEERIVVFSAASSARAVSAAKKIGRSGEFSYHNDDQNPVHVEFVGVTDLLRHGPEMEHGVVWYDITTKRLPKERRAALILTDKQLLRRACR